MFAFVRVDVLAMLFVISTSICFPNCTQTRYEQLVVVYGYVALVVDDDVKLFHGVVVPVVEVGHDPTRHCSSFETFQRSQELAGFERDFRF